MRGMKGVSDEGDERVMKMVMSWTGWRGLKG